MRDRVEKSFDVSVEHVSVPLLMEFPDAPDGIVGGAPRSKAVRVVVKERLEERT